MRIKDLLENMDHSKDAQAVPQLKAALLTQKAKLKQISNDKVKLYKLIDGLMTSVAKAHGLTGQQMHDMWVKKYKEIPDTWVLNKL